LSHNFSMPPLKVDKKINELSPTNIILFLVELPQKFIHDQ
jgi:hypothetical protein